MSEESEEKEQTLEEKITSLRQQELTDEQIVRAIFQENLNADVTEICRVTGLDKLVVGRIKGQVSRWHKRQEKPTEEAREAPPESGLYKTEPDANAILDEILSTHPEITTKIKAEIMDWAKRRGSLDPGFLAWLLSSFRGMTQTTANVVSQKYALALQRAQQEGRIQLPMGFPMWPLQQQPPQWGFSGFPYPQGFPQQQLPVVSQQQPPPFSQPQSQPPSYVTPYGQPQPPGWGYPSPPSLTEEKIRSIIREERQPKEVKEPEQYVEIEDPVRDNTGNVIVGDDGRAIVKKTRVPASQASQFFPKEDVELRVLEKLEKYKKIFGSELTEEKIREIVREERPAQPPTTPLEKPVTLEDVKQVSSEAASKAAQTAVSGVLEAREKEDKEEKRHQATLAAIRESGSARTVEGYHEDSYRFMGQGLHEVAAAAREKKPLEIIVHDGGRLLLGGSPEKEVEAGASEGLLKRLKEKGWVVEQ